MEDLTIEQDTNETLANLGEGDIVDAYRSGEGIAAIAERMGVARSDLQKILRRSLAECVVSRKVKYFFHPTFNLPKAEEMYRGSEPEELYRKSPIRKAPSGMTSRYIADLYTRPLLSPEGEKFLFKKYNYLKYRAVSLRDTLYVRHPKFSTLQEVDALLNQSEEVRNRITEANLRLVIPVAQKFFPQMSYLDFQELIDSGNDGLFSAVENFDVSLGNRFSTYGTVSVFRRLQKFRFEEMRRRSRERQDQDLPVDRLPLEDIRDSRSSSHEELRQLDITTEVQRLMRHIPWREAEILRLRFGLEGRENHTLEEVGDALGITKERVRQIEKRALEMLENVAQGTRSSLQDLLSD